MNIKNMTVMQKIMTAVFVIAVIGLCISIISARLDSNEAIIYDLDAVELYDKYKDYEGKTVRFAAEYEALIPEHNAITFSGGIDDYRKCIYAWMDDPLPDQSPNYSSDYLLIVGEVKDRGLGNLNLVNCRIEASGDNAYEFYKAHQK